MSPMWDEPTEEYELPIIVGDIIEHELEMLDACEVVSKT